MTKMRKTGYVTTEKGRNYLSGAGTTAFKAFSEVFKPTLDTMLKEMMKEAFRQRNEHIKNGTTPA
jgi:homoserine kinase